jgi:peptide/nickel transport system ATP-binding protein
VFLLGKVGIASAAERLGQYPHQLSGGLRQRVMIAMALMCGPDLLIADEPTTALDVTIQAQILRLLADLQRELGIAMLLITHDLGIVARIADRVAVMYAGQIVEEGTTGALFRSPKHPYTRGLIDCIPVPGRSVRGGRLGVIPGVVPALVGDIRGCSFRDRCSFAQDICAQAPPMRGTTDGQSWRCILESAA